MATGRLLRQHREMRAVHLAECVEVRGTTTMSGKSYVVRFACPVCSKSRLVNISRNAGRMVRCDGVRIQQVIRGRGPEGKEERK